MRSTPSLLLLLALFSITINLSSRNEPVIRSSIVELEMKSFRGEHEKVPRNASSVGPRKKPLRQSVHQVHIGGQAGPSSNTNSAPFNFSACLLVKDDNKVLPEWLAYHYTVLPLRHLVLGLDPFVLTSPMRIVNKYRELGMTIDIWNASDFLEKNRYIPSANATDEQKFSFHYARQEVFMSKCLQHLRSLERRWVLLVDSDEYVTFHNFESVASEGMHRDCRPLAPEPRQTCINQLNTAIRNGTHPRGRLPRIGEATLAEYIHSERSNAESVVNQYACIVLPRIWLTAQESKPKKTKRGVPPGFDAKNFVTLRYRHHSYFQNKFPGKSIVDVSRVDGDIEVGNPHRVLGNDCKYGPFVNSGESLFRIHHYIGSPEVFLFRPGDTHRTMEAFKSRNSYRVVGETKALVGWLPAFVREVGKTKALEVTQELRRWAFESDAEITKRAAKDHQDV